MNLMMFTVVLVMVMMLICLLFLCVMVLGFNEDSFLPILN